MGPVDDRIRCPWSSPPSPARTSRDVCALHEHLDADVSPERWARAVDVPWSPGLGFMLLDAGRVVGVQLAWSSQRTVDGRAERFCNLGAWCVLPEHRGHGLRLLRAALGQARLRLHRPLAERPEVVAINERLGFRHLDTATVLCRTCPGRLPGPVPLSDPAVLERMLTGDACSATATTRRRGRPARRPAATAPHAT